MKTLNKLTLAISAISAYLFQTGKYTAHNSFINPAYTDKLSRQKYNPFSLANRNTGTVLKARFFMIYFNLIELLHILYK
jgi:hypothetical protein